MSGFCGGDAWDAVIPACLWPESLHRHSDVCLAGLPFYYHSSVPFTQPNHTPSFPHELGGNLYLAWRGFALDRLFSLLNSLHEREPFLFRQKGRKTIYSEYAGLRLPIYFQIDSALRKLALRTSGLRQYLLNPNKPENKRQRISRGKAPALKNVLLTFLPMTRRATEKN